MINNKKKVENAGKRSGPTTTLAEAHYEKGR